jgi:hypothetical protein
VAQGRTLADLVKCITFYEHLGWIHTLALPRLINAIYKTQRLNLIEPIVKEYKFEAIHCLGASNWIREVVAIDGTGLVRGMDTSLPVVLGLAGLSVRDDTYVARGTDFFDATVDRRSLNWRIIDDNVATYLDWAGSRILPPGEDPS